MSAWAARRISKRVLGVATALALALACLASGASAYNNDIDGVNHALQGIAEVQARHLSEHIGIKLANLHLAVGWASHPDEVPNGLTGTNEDVDGPGDLDGPICEIAINKHWFAPIPRYEKGEILVHEVFHCFEKEITPRAKYEGAWLSEGLARWADLTLFPKTHLGGPLGALSDYYDSPQTTVFDRSYDAVGFWAHVQDVTDDLWKRIPAIVFDGADYKNQKAVNAALKGVSEASFLAEWGSSAFDLLAGPTPIWRSASPLGARRWPSLHDPTNVADTSSFALKPYSTVGLKLEANAAKPLIEIYFAPAVHGTFGVSTDYVDTAVTSKLFCSASEPSGCQCPAGYIGTVPPTTPLPAEPLLGAASDELGGSVQITYLSMQTSGYCKPEVLVSGPTCEHLLPGFSDEADGTIEKVTGQHIAVETHAANGYVSYSCPIQYKGEVVKVKDEEAFRGVLAFLTTVETFPSDAAAQKLFLLKKSAAAIGLKNSLALPTSGIGEESFVQSGAVEINSRGEGECASFAAVRVHNVVASYGLGGIETEACGKAAVNLLAAVPGEL